MAKLATDVKDNLDKSLRRDAQTAINEEMTVVRQQLDAQLHDAVERAIKVSMERVSESSVRKVVQQAAEQTAKIVDEARRATETNAGQLDEKVRQAVEQAVSHAAADAAQQAAAQAATQNLKQTVEEAVARIVAEREATSPSLQILANPGRPPNSNSTSGSTIWKKRRRTSVAARSNRRNPMRPRQNRR